MAGLARGSGASYPIVELLQRYLASRDRLASRIPGDRHRTEATAEERVSAKEKVKGMALRWWKSSQRPNKAQSDSAEPTAPATTRIRDAEHPDARGEPGIAIPHDQITVEVPPHIYACTVAIGSAAHDAARHLQAQRFAQVQGAHAAPAANDRPSYVEATDYAPQRTIPIAVYRMASISGRRAQGAEMIGTARVELAGATLIEHMIRLKPESATAQAFAQGTVAEIGGFATLPSLDRATLLDTIDAVVAVVLRLAAHYGLNTFLLFPRNGFMSLMRATITDLLPPYQFRWCPDVAGWNEESEELARFRALELRGLGRYPDIFQIATAEFAANLAARQVLVARRHEQSQALEGQLTRAMVHAQRDIMHEIVQERQRGSYQEVIVVPSTPSDHHLHEPDQLDQLDQLDQPDQPADGSAVAQAQHDAEHQPDSTMSNALPSATEAHNFLPFTGGREREADYLRSVVAEGGSPAQAYKHLSYHLLEVQQGMRILDVGCGAGVDLPELARITGNTGAVIGIDRDTSLVATCRKTLAERGVGNAWVYEGDAERLTFAVGEFDRVRADRAVQHMHHPERALAEMRRVLKPGGILTIIEPDWPAIALYPGSAAGGNDDRAFQYTLTWCRQHLAHPLIGRQLHALLRDQGSSAWSDMRVVTQLYPFTNWSMLDAVLKLSQVAAAIQGEDDIEKAAEVTSWLDAVQAADAQGKFFAAVPLFFTHAIKAPGK